MADMRRLASIAGWFGLLLVLHGCVSPVPGQIHASPPNPQQLFVEVVADNPYGIAPDVDVLELPPAARQLVDVTLRRKATRRLRVQALGELFIRGGGLGMQYETMSTGTAAATFEQRQGNCLAYTHLFIAMARYAGLDARYREVLGVAQWEANGEFVLLNRHIAAYGELGKQGTYVADFGFLYESERNFGRVVSDGRARAQHFNNLGARELVSGDIAAAIRLFARGLTIDGDLGYLWSNLGTAYLRDGDLKHAELALQHASRLTPWDVTTLNQLTRLYDVMGRPDLTAQYRRRSEAARRQNPYLQFTWALEARDEGRLDAAIGYLRHAAQNAPDELYFWLELAKTYLMRGKVKDARKTLYRAEALVETAEQRTAFIAAIESLTDLSGGEKGTPAPPR
jgi:tetratricopeptide (TPR) repeat protein